MCFVLKIKEKVILELLLVDSWKLTSINSLILIAIFTFRVRQKKIFSGSWSKDKFIAKFVYNKTTRYWKNWLFWGI